MQPHSHEHFFCKFSSVCFPYVPESNSSLILSRCIAIYDELLGLITILFRKTIRKAFHEIKRGCKEDLERSGNDMKIGDKQTEFCEKCKTDQKFEVSEISEYGKVFGRCDKCNNSMKL